MKTSNVMDWESMFSYRRLHEAYPHVTPREFEKAADMYIRLCTPDFCFGWLEQMNEVNAKQVRA